MTLATCSKQRRTRRYDRQTGEERTSIHVGLWDRRKAERTKRIRSASMHNWDALWSNDYAFRMRMSGRLPSLYRYATAQTVVGDALATKNAQVGHEMSPAGNPPLPITVTHHRYGRSSFRSRWAWIGWHVCVDARRSRGAVATIVNAGQDRPVRYACDGEIPVAARQKVSLVTRSRSLKVAVSSRLAVLIASFSSTD